MDEIESPHLRGFPALPLCLLSGKQSAEEGFGDLSPIMQHTKIFDEFGECLEIELHDLTINDEDFYQNVNMYKNKLEDLRIEIDFKWVLEDEHLEKYLKTRERTPSYQMSTAKREVHSIVEKLQDINKHLDKLIPKRKVRDFKLQETERKRQVKLEADRVKNELLNEKNRIKEETKLQKEKERLESSHQKNEVIPCDTCGEPHIRSKKFQHLTSNIHKARIDSIKWFLNKHSLCFDNTQI